MTVHLFYLKWDKALYAFTLTKEYAQKFLEQRNPDSFIYVKKKVPEIYAQIFMNEHMRKKLDENPYVTCRYDEDHAPINGSEKNVTLLSTREEESALETYIMDMEEAVECVESILQKADMKEEYQKSVKRLLEIDNVLPGKKNTELVIDTMGLFMDIHWRTWISPDKFDGDEDSYDFSFSISQIANEKY